MKRLAILFVALFSVAAFAQDLPKIAVYVTGDVPDNEKKALGTRMLASLIKSGRYKGIERSNSFLAEIEKEQVKQRSGAIDDSQISELGRQFGVKFVCISDITPAFGAYQVSARIVDVETAEVGFIGEANSPLKTMDDLSAVSDKVVRIMFNLPEPREGADSSPRKSNMGISAGVGAFFAGGFGGGIKWPDGEAVSMPYSGGGAYLFVDALYAEAYIGYSAGGGTWESAAATDAGGFDLQRSYVNIGALGKYPVNYGQLKLFPLLGFEYGAAVSGKLKRTGEDDYTFNGAGGRPDAGDLSALWVKLGGGVDCDINESVYLRGELLYGVRTATAFETDGAKYNNSGGEAMTGTGLAVRIGAGVRF
jgi:hypothetical protein